MGQEEVPQEASVTLVPLVGWGCLCLPVSLCMSLGLAVSPPSPESYSLPQAGLEFSM